MSYKAGKKAKAIWQEQSNRQTSALCNTEKRGKKKQEISEEY